MGLASWWREQTEQPWGEQRSVENFLLQLLKPIAELQNNVFLFGNLVNGEIFSKVTFCCAKCLCWQWCAEIRSNGYSNETEVSNHLERIFFKNPLTYWCLQCRSFYLPGIIIISIEESKHCSLFHRDCETIISLYEKRFMETFLASVKSFLGA